MRLKTYLFFGIVVIVMMGCSVRKMTKTFSVSSNIPGAQVLVDGAPAGTTPVNVTMNFEINLDYPDRGLIRHQVVVQKDGYKAEKRSVYHNDPPNVHFVLEPPGTDIAETKSPVPAPLTRSIQPEKSRVDRPSPTPLPAHKSNDLQPSDWAHKKKHGKKLNIAVYPFKAAGVSESTAKALTNIIGYELNESDIIRVIEESNLETVLDQQGLSQSGACDDSECQIQIGKLLNSEKFVRGELNRIGKRYIITMKVVNIQSGRTEFTTKGECRCNSEEELPDVILAPVNRLMCFLETNDKNLCSEH